MKSLDQIASTGIAIKTNNLPNDADNHFIINSSGSYFLTGNLFVTKTNGITVTAANVSIDLNGFEILRTGGVGGAGITIDSICTRIKRSRFLAAKISYAIGDHRAHAGDE